MSVIPEDLKGKSLGKFRMPKIQRTGYTWSVPRYEESDDEYESDSSEEDFSKNLPTSMSQGLYD